MMIMLTQGGGWGVQNQGKPADVILEHSLMAKTRCPLHPEALKVNVCTKC